MNEQHSKEEYAKKLAALDFGSYKKQREYFQKWHKFRLEKAVYRAAYLLNCENCSGNDLKNCKNTHHSFNATNCEDCKYLYDVLDAKDCQDLNYSLYKPEVAYEIISSLQSRFCAFLTGGSTYNRNSFYSDSIQSCQDVFGCVALRQGKYCILNKQYSKEEYENLRTRLIEHMKETGEYGEFFPSKNSPWGYNETVASEYYPLSKEEALKQGFTWFDNPASAQRERETERESGFASSSEVELYKKNYPTKIPQTYQIPDHIRDVPETITNEVLACTNPNEELYKKGEERGRPLTIMVRESARTERGSPEIKDDRAENELYKCGKNFKIISQELAFYRQKNIPVPRKCPDCRHRDRIKLRAPRRLFGRTCSKCGKSIQSAFAPERPEKVYCEPCYLAALY